MYPDSDGTVIVRGRLTPEVGAVLVQALAAARETLYQQARDQEPEGDPPTTTRYSWMARVPAGTSQRPDGQTHGDPLAGWGSGMILANSLR